MHITRADELRSKYTREQIIYCFCNRLMEKINKANEDGYRKTCFYVCGGYWDHKDNTLTYKDNGEQYHRWEDYESEIRKVFLDAGYKIKPTGYIGGVWQLTEDIMW